MRRIWLANTTVTFLQLVVIIIASVAGVETSILPLIAAITAGVIALSMVYDTWKHTHPTEKVGQVGFSAVIAMLSSFSFWLVSTGEVVFSGVFFGMSIFLAQLFARQAKKYWAKDEYWQLFVAAIPNLGVILGGIVGLDKVLTPPYE
jgi:hypothetical protein